MIRSTATPHAGPDCGVRTRSSFVDRAVWQRSAVSFSGQWSRAVRAGRSRSPPSGLRPGPFRREACLLVRRCCYLLPASPSHTPHSLSHTRASAALARRRPRASRYVVYTSYRLLYGVAGTYVNPKNPIHANNGTGLLLSTVISAVWAVA
jgi:hypothetical protein